MSIGIPGLRGTDHIGLTVPDIDQAISFFCHVIGGELIYQTGTFEDSLGSFMVDYLNVHARARIKAVAFIRCGDGCNYELFEYWSPDQQLTAPKNSDVGGHHLGFYVDDINEGVAHLHKHNVRVLGEPVQETEGPGAGESWVYFLSPWGLQMELISYPDGKAYQRSVGRVLWQPDRLS
ncbi:VOC family protein [Brucella sp. NBRC 12950]|uniref:VOC family protein n=1 Tax=Brucella sp. NBRC 12950 TaxID=2994518 RepID=UPI0024A22E16|nr:VOC family protein [Brucella sp. NBRC 12950]GLU29834.1 glyoxalase [Brucella sp. NBRC 12950]